ncbi:MAG TPA: hypothetical protein VJK52_03520 [Candidatus Nanoarchaeia archaeon]|nr:hypothetical protein [Candidatus Nanoarchaeia archaeon]
MAHKVFVIGEAVEKKAVIAAPIRPRLQDLALLTDHFGKKMNLLLESTPDASFQTVLEWINAVGNSKSTTIESTPDQSIVALLIAFTNGWNAYFQSLGSTFVPLDARQVQKKWKEEGQDYRTIEGQPLSKQTANMLQSLIIPEEIKEIMLAALDRYDLHEWLSIIMAAVVDGWNGARGDLLKRQGQLN